MSILWLELKECSGVFIITCLVKCVFFRPWSYKKIFFPVWPRGICFLKCVADCSNVSTFCFLSFEDQIVLRETNTNKIISTFEWKVKHFLCVKNLFENTYADNSSFAIFSFAMNSQIKGKRMAEVKMLRHIVLSPSRTTWSEIYCKKRWSFYTCRLHGSNVGQRWKCETCQWSRTVKEMTTSFKINH